MISPCVVCCKASGGSLTSLSVSAFGALVDILDVFVTFADTVGDDNALLFDNSRLKPASTMKGLDLFFSFNITM